MCERIIFKLATVSSLQQIPCYIMKAAQFRLIYTDKPQNIIEPRTINNKPRTINHLYCIPTVLSLSESHSSTGSMCFALRIREATSRIAPLPPEASVIISARHFSSEHAFATATETPATSNAVRSLRSSPI